MNTIMNHQIRTASLLMLIALSISACTAIPQQLAGEYAPLTPENTTEKDLEKTVRWGGLLLETRPQADHTCFEVLFKPLQRSMRPVRSDRTGGRFIACKPGFYDPEIFEKEREVTLTGKIIYIDTRKVGDYDYQFPVVDIKFMSLWPERRERDYYDRLPPYMPYYWRYPGFGFRYHYPY